MAQLHREKREIFRRPVGGTTSILSKGEGSRFHASPLLYGARDAGNPAGPTSWTSVLPGAATRLLTFKAMESHEGQKRWPARCSSCSRHATPRRTCRNPGVVRCVAVGKTIRLEARRLRCALDR